jgi:hypothetical protein
MKGHDDGGLNCMLTETGCEGYIFLLPWGGSILPETTFTLYNTMGTMRDQILCLLGLTRFLI